MVKKFEQQYWKENYSNLDEMDGVSNATAHVRYLKSLFDLHQLEISSLIDWGAGLGHLLEACCHRFRPYKVHAIEISEYACKRLGRKKFVQDYKVKITQKDLVQWAEAFDSKSKYFDLGICNSVLQYISNRELPRVIDCMARQVKYLYLSVPTAHELKLQKEVFDFQDRYAISRPAEFYRRLLQKKFTMVSRQVFESRHFFSSQSSPFHDELFRF